jgi:hypothetical protein
VPGSENLRTDSSDPHIVERIFGLDDFAPVSSSSITSRGEPLRMDQPDVRHIIPGFIYFEREEVKLQSSATYADLEGTQNHHVDLESSSETLLIDQELADEIRTALQKT